MVTEQQGPLPGAPGLPHWGPVRASGKRHGQRRKDPGPHTLSGASPSLIVHASRGFSASPALLPSQATTGLFLGTGLLTAALQAVARDPLKTQNTAHTLSGLPTTHSKRSPASSRPSSLARSPSPQPLPHLPGLPGSLLFHGQTTLPSGLRVLGSSLSFRSQLRCQPLSEAFPPHLPEKSSSHTPHLSLPEALSRFQAILFMLLCFCDSAH